jgi:hypothetical protein
MVGQRLRLALLIGAITAVAVSPVRANFRAPKCCDPCGSSSGCATAPAYRTVTCTEWVRENVTSTRTAYKVECRTETYDTFRTECVPVCREKVVSVQKRVPVWKEECRKVCHKETVWETRMVNKTSHKYVQETVMKKSLVRMGHWECRESTPLFGGFGGGNGGGLFGGHGHHGCNDACSTGCADSCNTACSSPCRTRTKKVWVHCPEYKECPTTVCKKVCVTECVPCKVAVCKNVWREEKVKVCSYTCVEEKQTVKCTTYETRKVACKATRTVRVCVPYQETVTCCKMVPKTVTRQVAVNNCSNACSTGNSCSTGNNCCERTKLFSGLGHRLRGNGDCCRPTSCCN